VVRGWVYEKPHACGVEQTEEHTDDEKDFVA
jgi:hypothetical protein